jgi:outer membrane lipoprotein-sorting protein
MRLRAAIVPVFLSPLLALAAGTESLDNVLTRMNRASASFRAVSADVSWTQHTAVINDDTVDTGTMLLKRTKHDIRMLINLTAPNARTIALHEQKLEIYYPEMHQVEEWDVGQHSELLHQFLLIGFGTSGKELAVSYSMKVLGSDTVAGQAALRLELVPKSTKVLSNLKKLELWIPESEAYPIQQKLFLAAGDYKLVTYTNVKVNPPLKDSNLELKVPKDTKRVFPQR